MFEVITTKLSCQTNTDFHQEVAILNLWHLNYTNITTFLKTEFVGTWRALHLSGPPFSGTRSSILWPQVPTGLEMIPSKFVIRTLTTSSIYLNYLTLFCNLSNSLMCNIQDMHKLLKHFHITVQKKSSYILFYG